MFSWIVARLFTDSSSPFCKKEIIDLLLFFRCLVVATPSIFLFLSTTAFLCPHHDLFARSAFFICRDKFCKLFDHPTLLRFLDFDVHLARVALVKLHISQEESFESRVTTLWLPSRWEPMRIFFSWVYSSWCLSPHRGALRKTCHRLGGSLSILPTVACSVGT